MTDDLAPAEQDFTLYQGENWRVIFQLYSDDAQSVPLDCTGSEIDINIREGVADSGATILLAASTRSTGDGANRIDWLSYASDGSVDEDETNGDPVDGVFRVDFTPQEMSELRATKKPRKGAHETASFIYDAKRSVGTAEAKRFLQGSITLDLETTRRG
jgi:hypothetical protein